MTTSHRLLRRATLGAYLALLIFVFVWEAWLAPSTPVPRTFWLALKTIPLLIPLPGLWRGNARTHVLAALLVLLYFCEGIADTYHAVKTNASIALMGALIELSAALLFIVLAPIHARIMWRRDPSVPARTES